MSVRVFIPVGAEDLAVLAAHHRLPGPVTAYAFTDALRAAWPEADQEEGEYAALMTAARVSRVHPGARRRVVAADVPEVAPGQGDDPACVQVLTDVVWKNVAAALVDLADGADEDDDLAWFATQEIPQLVR